MGVGCGECTPRLDYRVFPYGDAIARLFDIFPEGTLFLVGGAVRDAFMGKAVQDVDFATPLTPQEVVHLLTSQGVRTVPIGIEHGTVGALCDGVLFEITSFREDVTTDGRHAVVRFGTDILKDAQRRDFTVNGLYADASGQILDPLGHGLDDLASRNLRFIGNPAQRVQEDGLRVLRFFRFQAVLNTWVMCDEVFDVLVQSQRVLAGLSGERIRDELCQIFSLPHYEISAQGLLNTAVFSFLTGRGLMPTRLARLKTLEAVTQIDVSPLFRLAFGCCHTTQDIIYLGRLLKLSKVQQRELVVLSGVFSHRVAFSVHHVRVLQYSVGEGLFPTGLLWAAVYNGWCEEDVLCARDIPQTHPIPAFPIAADVLISRGFQGAEIRKGLDALKAAWIAADFPSELSSSLIERVLHRQGCADYDGVTS